MVCVELCRPDKDELLTDQSKRHLLVLRNGHMFVFDVLDENGLCHHCIAVESGTVELFLSAV